MRKIDNCPSDDVAAKLEPIQKMELENEVLVTGEGGKITTITQVEEHYHYQIAALKCKIDITWLFRLNYHTYQLHHQLSSTPDPQNAKLTSP